MVGTPSRQVSSLDVVHRIGGGHEDNLRLKEKEKLLDPPGISVLLGGTPQDAAERVCRTFPHATRLHLAAATVGTATVATVRKAGFDVILDPTRHFANHARLIHFDGAAGFSDKNLRRLARVFRDSVLE